MLKFDWHPEPVVVANEVDLLRVKLEDFKEPLTASLIPIMAAVEQRFEEEGPGWPAWAESYAPTADQTNEGGILWRFGDLVEGATNVGSYLVSEDSIVFTGAEEPPYWIFHPDGTSKMPARNFIGTDEQAENEIVLIFATFMESAINESRVAVTGGIQGPGGRFISHPLSAFGIH